MCGRFTLRASPSVIAAQFGIFEIPALTARFNIAPTQQVPVVRLQPGQVDGGHRELVLLRWGLVPGWATDATIGNRLINARAETAAEKPAFRSAMRSRRCLMVADGFYEWQKTGRARQPYFIRLRDDRPFGFAGLWESWQRPDRVPLETCTLLTTDANELVRPIHDRMPVILAPDSYAAWLDPSNTDPRALRPLLAPFPSAAMEAYPVSSVVNTPANDVPGCTEPLQRTLF